MRCYVPWIVSALLVTGASAQHAAKQRATANSAPLTQVTIEGTEITGSDLLVHKGVAYVRVDALARALGASLASQGQVAVLSLPDRSQAGSAQVSEERRLSDLYRKAAVQIPDAIESLRAQVSKPGAIVPASAFDDVDHQISESDYRVRTDADRSVSYALSHASNALAISYYKLRRGISPEEIKQAQLDSVLCSMESKFALQLGRLSGKESCSIFRPSPSRAESTTRP